MSHPQVTSPDSSAFAILESNLRQLVATRGTQRSWVDQELRLCADSGVLSWFHKADSGGQEWGPEQLTRGYLMLSRICLTTAFVLTQRVGACQRIESSPNRDFANVWMPRLIHGEAFATVGISQLTTSRQHVAQSVLQATQTSQGFLLKGYSPWITGALAADLFIVGASIADGRQVLLAVPRELEGVHVPPAAELLALEASQTGPVEFRNVLVPRSCLLQGPETNVLQKGLGAGTGGLQTTTLAVGLANAALQYLSSEASTRPAVQAVAEALNLEWNSLEQDLLAVARGSSQVSKDQLRQRANSLVLRITQAALATAKGAGFTHNHPVGRWCKEALFFLVWSCPQSVVSANLCEFAGLAD